MKKILIIMVALIGFGISANAQCDKFTTTDANASISGTTVTITVKVSATFTPDKGGSYQVIVSPTGQWAKILGSQRQSTTAYYSAQNGWSIPPVTFSCSVNDNTYNQCTSSDFVVVQCFARN